MILELICDFNFVLRILKKLERRLHMRMFGGDDRPHETQHRAKSYADADNLPHCDLADMNGIQTTRSAWCFQCTLAATETAW
jgi:hypothetical protein